jgi:hypothetical protein
MPGTSAQDTNERDTLSLDISFSAWNMRQIEQIRARGGDLMIRLIDPLSHEVWAISAPKAMWDIQDIPDIVRGLLQVGAL